MPNPPKRSFYLDFGDCLREKNKKGVIEQYVYTCEVILTRGDERDARVYDGMEAICEVGAFEIIDCTLLNDTDKRRL